MEAPVLVGGQARRLLSEVAGVGPGGAARVGARLGLGVGEVGVGRAIGGVPGEEHPRLGAGPAARAQVEERDARLVVDARVPRDPDLGVGARRVELHRFEQVPRAVPVDLIEATEGVRFAMRARDVLRGQDLEVIATLDHARLHDEALAQHGGPNDELLGKGEVVVGLALVVGEEIALRPGAWRVGEQAEEGGEHEVGRLPILLRAAREGEPVARTALVASLRRLTPRRGCLSRYS